MEIGQTNGLRYIYPGNVSGGTETLCPGCGKVMIKRTHFSVTENAIKYGKCPFCDSKIDGVFN